METKTVGTPSSGRWPRPVVIAVLGAALALPGILSGNVALTSFGNGEVADADQVNTNFANLKNAISASDATCIVSQEEYSNINQTVGSWANKRVFDTTKGDCSFLTFDNANDTFDLVAGTYHIQGSFTWNCSSTGTMITRLRETTPEKFHRGQQWYNKGDGVVVPFTAYFSIDSTKTFEAQSYNQSPTSCSTYPGDAIGDDGTPGSGGFPGGTTLAITNLLAITKKN